ncbi:MAG TPA: hypothetical protein VF652_01500 [Allosphingosinicella sp.]
MPDGEAKRQLDEAFERIEESILPSLSVMLDTLLEAATLARPGHDSEVLAAELRTLGFQLAALTRQIEAVSPAERIDPANYRAASAA